MPMASVNNEHEQLVSILNQLMDEREVLSRENEYLKAKLNESILVETINEMKRERDLLFKLLSNVTTKYHYDEQLRYIKQHLKENNGHSSPMPSYSTFNGRSTHCNNLSAKSNSSLSRHSRSQVLNHGYVHRLKANGEQQHPKVIYRIENRKENSINNLNRLSSASTTHIKSSDVNKKILLYKTPPTPEFNKLIRKQGIQLKHSQNSPFQHYRSQSLQDLT